MTVTLWFWLYVCLAGAGVGGILGFPWWLGMTRRLRPAREAIATLSAADAIAKRDATFTPDARTARLEAARALAREIESWPPPLDCWQALIAEPAPAAVPRREPICENCGNVHRTFYPGQSHGGTIITHGGLGPAVAAALCRDYPYGYFWDAATGRYVPWRPESPPPELQ